MSVKIKKKKVNKKVKLFFTTSFGSSYQGKIEDLIVTDDFKKYKGKVGLIFTSPPFPLNRKKKYGNLQGQLYVDWLSGLAEHFKMLLKKNGSIVIEVGNPLAQVFFTCAFCNRSVCN